MSLCQPGHRLIALKFRGTNPAHLRSFPVQPDSIRSSHLEKEWMNIPVPPYLCVLVLDHSPAPEHAYLLSLQACLLANLCVSLLVGRGILLDKTAHARPSTVIAPHALAPPHDQQARLAAIKAQQKASYNVCRA